MPELPEIETIRRALSPKIRDRRLTGAIVRHPTLRWPIPENMNDLVQGQTIHAVRRRSKYLLLDLDEGTLLVHLGMSGQLRLIRQDEPVGKHDHIDLLLDNGQALRLNDSRRFGAVLWAPLGTDHIRLQGLGPEPLSGAFTEAVLKKALHSKSSPIKTTIMDASVVVGVGNIYANEALFQSRIHPRRPANSLNDEELMRLVVAIREVLLAGIRHGGSTLKDFVHPDGSSGNFVSFMKVYGRAGAPCTVCGNPLHQARLGGRATVWCETCQH